MGADYTAIAVIGVDIDMSKIPVIRTKEKVGDHNYPETMNYDPVTGKQLWTIQEERQFSFFSDEDNCVVFPKDVKLFNSTDNEDYILGFGIDDTYSNGGNAIDSARLPDIVKLKEQLKALLEPFGMWDEERFKLYSILYCSY